MGNAVQRLEKEKIRQETRARLTVPAHITQNRFTEHHAIEGYYEDRKAANFFGCDRLWKMDTLYGTIQLGYDPKKGQSFLFSNIKTSIYDTASSSHQRTMVEADRMRELKGQNQNVAFASRRRKQSATLLYKMENKPWTEESVAPYTGRADMEALRKTMPFLNRREERSRREELRREKKRLELEIREALKKDAGKAAALRAKENRLWREQNEVNAILTRKQAQSLLFFRKVNMAFDLQKAKMFEYYRKERARRTVEAVNAPADTDQSGTGDQKNGAAGRNK